MSVLSRALVVATIALVPCWTLGAQEVRAPSLSPRDSVVETVGDARVVVDYGRPSKRRRKEIFGALVPYGVIWRTGANEATHLRADRDLVIGKLRVPRGTYTLWTIPEREQWTLIINRQTGQWGTEYDSTQDLGRVPMEVAPLETPLEQFTIAIDGTGNGWGVLRMSWDTTQASVPIRVLK